MLMASTVRLHCGIRQLSSYLLSTPAVGTVVWVTADYYKVFHRKHGCSKDHTGKQTNCSDPRDILTEEDPGLGQEGRVGGCVLLILVLVPNRNLLYLEKVIRGE